MITNANRAVRATTVGMVVLGCLAPLGFPANANGWRDLGGGSTSLHGATDENGQVRLTKSWWITVPKRCPTLTVKAHYTDDFNGVPNRVRVFRTRSGVREGKSARMTVTQDATRSSRTLRNAGGRQFEVVASLDLNDPNLRHSSNYLRISPRAWCK